MLIVDSELVRTFGTLFIVSSCPLVSNVFAFLTSFGSIVGSSKGKQHMSLDMSLHLSLEEGSEPNRKLEYFLGSIRI